jgi:predicted GNAT superfamily acetyltransferase
MIRDIETNDEIRAVEDLQKDVWGVDDREVVPITQLVAAKETGGQLIGAWREGTMIGFVYGFVGLEHGRIIHHSHMLAVKSEYRDSDVGYQLKLAQRDRVLGQGITRITWTFDPLQSRNAHFNFAKLGVVSDSYKADIYGPESSSFGRNIASDRLWVTWPLDAKRKTPPKPDAPMLVDVDAQSRPRERELPAGTPHAFIAIPRDINALPAELAVLWRNATRRAFTAALDQGFVVANFFRDIGAYLLTRGSIEDFA